MVRNIIIRILWWIEKSKEQYYLKQKSSNIVNVSAATFDQFNVLLLKNNNFNKKNLTDPKLLNGSVIL